MNQGWLFLADRLAHEPAPEPETLAPEPPSFTGYAATVRNTNLIAYLTTAVPAWIEKVRKLPPAVRAAMAKDVVPVIEAKGDVLMFGGGKKGEAAHLFNELARGLAVLSFVPGGVKFAGMKWESTA